MSHIHLTKEDIVGSYDRKGKLDLLNIVMVGLAKELVGHGEKYELHRLPGALLSQQLSLQVPKDLEAFFCPLKINLIFSMTGAKWV